MGISRRQAMGGVLAGLGIAMAGAGCSRSGGSNAPTDGDIRLTFGWWGNELRNAQTAEAVALYLSQNPGLSIEQTPAEFNAYWDRLATQTAGGSAPDMIQMADGFLAEYGSRGALLDLEPYVDVSRFGEGTVDVGRVDGTLVGINAGINSPVIMCNTAVWEQAGVPLPDDLAWTWDDYRDLAAEITAASPDGTFGSATPGVEGVLRAWLRQHDEELFHLEGAFGASQEGLRGYFDLLQGFVAASAIPPAATIVEDAALSLEQQPVAVGTSGMAMIWSNQYSALSSVASSEIAMLKLPTVTGDAADMKAWYHPSMLWSASARTEKSEAVAALIDWWVNSVDCAQICLDERGRPANTEVLGDIESSLSEEGRKVSTFLAELEPYLGDPQPVPPPGSGEVLGDILTRTQQELYFGNIDVDEATERFIAESTSALSS